MERFWSKIEKTKTCWIWKAGKNLGYGQFSFNGKNILAHRFSYELVKGKIPEGLDLDHLCRNRSCVNPEHLQIVTNKENVLRGMGITAINSRKTHCGKGHEFTQKNTRITRNGRQCVTCTIENSRQWREQNKEKVKKYSKQYRESNLLLVRKRVSKWEKLNTEKIRLQKKEYYQKNKERIREVHKKYKENKKLIE